MASAFPAVETEEKGVTLRTAACVVFFSSIGIFAYPLIYPVVDYILSIIDFAENRNFKSVIDLYNTITGNDIFPQDPVVEALSYWDKARILYFVQVTAYLSLTAITAIGAILFALSRLLPGRFLQSTMRGVGSFFLSVGGDLALHNGHDLYLLLPGLATMEWQLHRLSRLCASCCGVRGRLGTYHVFSPWNHGHGLFCSAVCFGVFWCL